MSGQDKTKYRANGEKLTAEFTSGQLVIAICVSLFFMLSCFLLGVLVGKYDSSLRGTELQEAKATTTEKTDDKKPASASPDRTGASDPGGIQKYPRTDALTRQTPGAADANRYTRRDERTGPRVTELSPLPSNRAASPETPTAPLKVEKSPDTQETASPGTAPAPSAPAPAPGTPVVPAAGTTTPPTPTPASPAPASPVSPTNILTPVDPPAETASSAKTPTPAATSTPSPTVAPPAPAAAAPPAAQTPAPPAGGKGKFGIQVAAFTGASRKTKGEEALRRFKADAQLAPQLVSYDDGKYYRVMLTGFKDRASASAACAELRKKPGWTDVFVKPMP